MGSSSLPEQRVECDVVVGGKDTGTLDLKASVAARGQGRDRQLQEEVRAAVRGQLGKGLPAPRSPLGGGDWKAAIAASGQSFSFPDNPRLPVSRQLLTQLLRSSLPADSGITAAMNVGDAPYLQHLRESLGVEHGAESSTSQRLHQAIAARHYVRPGAAPPPVSYEAPADPSGWVVWAPTSHLEQPRAWVLGQVVPGARPSLPPLGATRCTAVSVALPERAAASGAAGAEDGSGGAGRPGTMQPPCQGGAPAAAQLGAGSRPQASSAAPQGSVAPVAAGPGPQGAGDGEGQGGGLQLAWSVGKRGSQGYLLSQGQGTPLADVLDNMERVDAAAMLNSQPSGCRDLLDMFLDPKDPTMGDQASGFMSWKLPSHQGEAQDAAAAAAAAGATAAASGAGAPAAAGCSSGAQQASAPGAGGGTAVPSGGGAVGDGVTAPVEPRATSAAEVGAAAGAAVKERLAAGNGLPSTSAAAVDGDEKEEAKGQGEEGGVKAEEGQAGSKRTTRGSLKAKATPETQGKGRGASRGRGRQAGQEASGGKENGQEKKAGSSRKSEDGRRAAAAVEEVEKGEDGGEGTGADKQKAAAKGRAAVRARGKGAAALAATPVRRASAAVLKEAKEQGEEEEEEGASTSSSSDDGDEEYKGSARRSSGGRGRGAGRGRGGGRGSSVKPRGKRSSAAADAATPAETPSAAVAGSLHAAAAEAAEPGPGAAAQAGAAAGVAGVVAPAAAAWAPAGPRYERPVLAAAGRKQRWLPILRFDTGEVMWAPVSVLSWLAPAPKELARLQAAAAKASQAAAQAAAAAAAAVGGAGRGASASAGKENKGQGTPQAGKRSKAAAQEGSPEGLGAGGKGAASAPAKLRGAAGGAGASEDKPGPPGSGGKAGSAASAIAGDCEEALHHREVVLKHLVKMRPDATDADVARYLTLIELKSRTGNSKVVDKTFTVAGKVPLKLRSYTEVANSIHDLMTKAGALEVKSDSEEEARPTTAAAASAAKKAATAAAAVAADAAAVGAPEATGAKSGKAVKGGKAGKQKEAEVADVGEKDKPKGGKHGLGKAAAKVEDAQKAEKAGGKAGGDEGAAEEGAGHEKEEVQVVKGKGRGRGGAVGVKRKGVPKDEGVEVQAGTQEKQQGEQEAPAAKRRRVEARERKGQGGKEGAQVQEGAQQGGGEGKAPPEPAQQKPPGRGAAAAAAAEGAAPAPKVKGQQGTAVAQAKAKGQAQVSAQGDEQPKRGRKRQRRRGGAATSGGGGAAHSGASDSDSDGDSGDADSDAPTTAHVEIVPPREPNPRRASAKRFATLNEDELEEDVEEEEPLPPPQQQQQQQQDGDGDVEVVGVVQGHGALLDSGADGVTDGVGPGAEGRGRGGRGRGRGGRGRGGRGRGRGGRGSADLASPTAVSQADVSAELEVAAITLDKSTQQQRPQQQSHPDGAVGAVQQAAASSTDVLRAVLQHLSDVAELVQASALPGGGADAHSSVEGHPGDGSSGSGGEGGKSGQLLGGGAESAVWQVEVQRLVGAVLGTLLGPGVLMHAGVGSLIQHMVLPTSPGTAQRQEHQDTDKAATAAAVFASSGDGSDVAVAPGVLLTLGASVSLFPEQQLYDMASELGVPLVHDAAGQYELRAQLLYWTATAAAELQAGRPSGPSLTVEEVLQLTSAAAELQQGIGPSMQQPMQLLLPLYRQIQRQGHTLVALATLLARAQQGQVGGPEHQGQLQAAIAGRMVALAQAALGTQTGAGEGTAAGSEPAAAPFAALRTALRLALQGMAANGNPAQGSGFVPQEVTLALLEGLNAARQQLQAELQGQTEARRHLEGLDAAGVQAGVALHAAGITSHASLVQGIADVLVLQRAKRWGLPLQVAVAAVAGAALSPSDSAAQPVLSLLKQLCSLV